MPTALTVTLITLNAGSCIRRCLESVQWADEIVVIDCGSTDATLSIAKEFTTNIIHNDWLGYGPQKRFATAQARHDWILSLDADEWLSTELAANIRNLMQKNPPHNAYTLIRCNRFMGKSLRHGEGYPDRIVRLFKRTHADWSEDKIHEKVIIAGTIGDLSGDLFHESENGIAAYLEKQNNYTTLQAEDLYNKGKKINFWQLLLSPSLRFIKFYFIRQGYRDGLPGLIHIVIGCFNSFVKYAKLLELNNTQKTRKD